MLAATKAADVQNLVCLGHLGACSQWHNYKRLTEASGVEIGDRGG